jgi:hypothetical protein
MLRIVAFALLALTADAYRTPVGGAVGVGGKGEQSEGYDAEHDSGCCWVLKGEWWVGGGE